jgi:hypothetical protein
MASFVLQEDALAAGDDDVGAAATGDDVKSGAARCAACGLLTGRFRGAECPNDGTSVRNLGLKPGFWRTSNASDELDGCPQPDFCVGGFLSGPNATASYCTEGHEGPYCAVCASDYYPSLLGTCVRCSGTNAESVLYLLLVVCGVGGIAGAVWKFKPHKRISEKGYKRAKNMGKILFVFTQVISPLP